MWMVISTSQTNSTFEMADVMLLKQKCPWQYRGLSQKTTELAWDTVSLTCAQMVYVILLASWSRNIYTKIYNEVSYPLIKQPLATAVVVNNLYRQAKLQAFFYYIEYYIAWLFIAPRKLNLDDNNKSYFALYVMNTNITA